MTRKPNVRVVCVCRLINKHPDGLVMRTVAYRGDHAVILLPGTATTAEGNEEDDDAHYYQNYRNH